MNSVYVSKDTLDSWDEQDKAFIARQLGVEPKGMSLSTAVAEPEPEPEAIAGDGKISAETLKQWDEADRQFIAQQLPHK